MFGLGEHERKRGRWFSLVLGSLSQILNNVDPLRALGQRQQLMERKCRMQPLLEDKMRFIFLHWRVSSFFNSQTVRKGGVVVTSSPRYLKCDSSGYYYPESISHGPADPYSCLDRGGASMRICADSKPPPPPHSHTQTHTHFFKVHLTATSRSIWPTCVSFSQRQNLALSWS